MRVGSLFSGIGGLELGLERSGMCVMWQVEIDPFCQSVLQRRWPTTPRHADVRVVGQGVLTAVDLICGGFPCQDVSIAGARAGIKEGTRSGLWFEYARILSEMEPQYALIENVAALRYKRGGLGIVLRDMAALGYDAEWHCVPAAHVGAPHERDRTFILAYRDGAGGPRLVAGRDSRFARQWNWRGETDLRAIAESPFASSTHWPQPLLRGVDDGVPDRLARLSAYGNAVVPQVAEWIGNQIRAWEIA